MFRKSLNIKFSEITFLNKKLSKQEIAENRIFKKMNKNDFVQKDKIIQDKIFIKELIEEIEPGGSVNLISNKIDSPNIIKSLSDQIEKIYISTFTITPAGMSALKYLFDNGDCKECILLLSNIQTSKWLIVSGAYKILKGKVKIRLCQNHSKLICIQTKTGFINFIGSMNFSNNPRYENIIIDKNEETFLFYSDFIKTVKAKIL